MATWLYYSPDGGVPLEDEEGAFRASNVETVGPQQLALIDRLRDRSMIMHKDNAEECALWRLAKRGLVRRGKLGGPRIGYVRVWTLTPRGRRAWLRVQVRS